MDPKLYKVAASGNIDLFSEMDPSFFLQETLEKNSALHLAAKFKQEQFAEKMIENYPQLLYQANSNGDTPLHIAANVGCLEIARLLTSSLDIESQQNVEANKEPLRMVNLEKDTALHNAVRNDHLDIVKLLIEKDPELAGFINANGDSALFLAADRKLFPIALHILDSAPACSYQGRNQMNALHAAIIRQNWNSVLSILDGIRFNPSLAIDFEKKFLVTRGSYIKQGKLKLLTSFFLKKHPDESLIDFIQNNVVTRHPASYNQVEEMLGNRGEDFMQAFIEKFPSAIQESDEFGWTPLHYAAFLGNTIAVELLRKNYDEQMPHHVYYKDKEGLSALHIAAKEGRVHVMKLLIESFPDSCELLDDSGRTALHVAVENGMVGTVEYVLKTPSLEGLINVQDKEGNTSLHLAAFHGHYKILIMLLDDWRVDKKAMNKERLTATEIILSKMELTDFQQFRIATKLLRAGSLPSLEGVLRRENAENQNVEIKATIVKNLAIDKTKRKPAEDKELKFNSLKERASTQVLVATIILTVTFAAGFTMPGGYKSDGPGEGMANFSGKTGFESFLISDSIAFCFSAASMFFHFLATVETDTNTTMFLMEWACALTYYSLLAMVIAFISGTSVVLAGSSGLAIANLGGFFFPLLLPLFRKFLF